MTFEPIAGDHSQFAQRPPEAETSRPAGRATPAERLRRIQRTSRRYRLAAVAAAVALLAIHLGVTYALVSELDPIVVAVEVAIAGVVLMVALLQIQRITRERRRHAVVEELVVALVEPRDIADTAASAAAVLVGSGLVEACLIAVTQDDGGQRESLVAMATAGYPVGWVDEAPARPLPPHNTLQRPQQENSGSDAWLVPAAPVAGGRPWVARLPIARGEEVLGLALLLTRRRASVDDRLLLETIGAQLAGALDYASLYQAAYERASTLEEQESRRREFLFAIAHELRSPLTSIQTFAELLQSDHEPEDDTAELLMSSLSRGVDRLGTFVNDLLDLGRVEEAHVKVELVPLDVREVLRGAEAMLRPSFMLQEQALTIELPDEPLPAMADERALEQVLLNLLSNANRFTPKRGAVIVRGMLQSGRVRLEIEDSGPGIDPADREAIFQAFYRVQRSGAPEVPGSGLGLAVAHRLTEMQGGRIWVEDGRSSTGSCFCVELPIAAAAFAGVSGAPPNRAQQPAAQPAPEPATQSGPEPASRPASQGVVQPVPAFEEAEADFDDGERDRGDTVPPPLEGAAPPAGMVAAGEPAIDDAEPLATPSA